MKTVERYFASSDRYEYDSDICRPSEGWCQVDTKKDASYYGTWCNPFTGVITSYCEGDVTVETCGSNHVFIKSIKWLVEWNEDNGYWQGIDCGWYPDELELKFTQLGLLHLLH